MDEILERRRADAARSRGAARATIPADVDVNPSTRDVRRSSGKTRPRAGRRRARGPRLGRCHSPCPTRVGGESRRRGVACRAKGRARTSGRKQLNPSSKSGCPPRRLFTRRTTSGVSDLRIGERGASERGGHRAELRWILSAENATLSGFYAPRVLEVAHDLQEGLVHLRVSGLEPGLHRANVRQRILRRPGGAVRRHRRGHLPVMDSLRAFSPRRTRFAGRGRV